MIFTIEFDLVRIVFYHKPKNKISQIIIMSDDEKQLIAEQIAKRSFDVIEAEAKLNTPTISKYYQKQYEKYMKPSVKDDIQDAFFEKVKSEPEKKRSINYGQDSFWRYDHGKETKKTHRYNLRGL